MRTVLPFKKPRTNHPATTMGRVVLMGGLRVLAATAAALILTSFRLHPRCDGIKLEGDWGAGSVFIRVGGFVRAMRGQEYMLPRNSV